MIPTDLKEFHGIYHFHCLSPNNKSNVFIQIILVKQCAYNLDPVAERERERVRILPRENKTTRLPRSFEKFAHQIPRYGRNFFFCFGMYLLWFRN